MVYRHDLLGRVHEVCQLHWRSQGKPDVQIEEQESRGLSYLRVSYGEGPWTEHRLVGVHDGRPDLATLRNFRALTTGRIELVHLTSTTPDLAETARDMDIWLRPFPDYQSSLWNPATYLRTQHHWLRGDPEYPLDLYVDKSWALLGAADPEPVTVLPTVLEWLSVDGPRFVLVLGDFGTGKTFLLRSLADALTTSDLVPVLVTMRDLEKGRSLDELLAQHMARLGEDPFRGAAFRYLLREGRIALLFDGFDELALRTSYDRVPQHFATLREAAGGSAKVVVTSRHQYFATDQAVRNALGDEVHRMQGSRIIRLFPLQPAQRRDLVVRTFDDRSAADEFIEAIRGVPNLLDLATNPRMLAFMIRWYREGILTRSTLAANSGAQMTAGALYSLLLTTWLAHEVSRQLLVGGLPPLSVEQRMDALRETAMRMWRSGQRSLSLADLGSVADRISDLARLEMRPGEAVQAVGSSTVLVRTPEEEFAFIHQSVMEWFVADAASRALADGSIDAFLADKELTRPMVDFWRDLSGTDAVVTWAREMAARLDAPGLAVKANSALVLREGETVGVFRAVNADLRGQDLSNQDLSGANLDGANLANAVLPKNMRGASLVNAKLTGARLVNVDLTGADLRGANLHRARLTGADLTDADLGGAWLERAVLIGANVTANQLARANTYGAALPGTAPAPQLTNDSLITALAALPHGLLASGHADGTIRIHDTTTRETLLVLGAHDHPVDHLAAANDGQLASASGDGVIRLWDSGSGTLIRRLSGLPGPAGTLVFEPNGEWVAAAAGNDVNVWTSDFVPRNAFRVDEPVLALAAHPKDGSLYTVGSMVQRWREGREDGVWPLPEGIGKPVGLAIGVEVDEVWVGGQTGIGILGGKVRSGQIALFTGAGDLMASASSASVETYLQSGLSGVHNTPAPDVRVLTVAPDGGWFATASGPEIRVWAPNTSDLGGITAHPAPVTALADVPGSGELVTIGAAAGVGWNLRTGQPFTFDGDQGKLAMDGKIGHLIHFGRDGSVGYLQSYAGYTAVQKLFTLATKEVVTNVAHDPVRGRIAVATTDSAMVFNMRNGRFSRRGLGTGFRDVALDLKGRWLAGVRSSDGRVVLWHFIRPTGIVGAAGTLRGEHWANVITAHPDGWLVTGGASVDLWNLKTRERTASYGTVAGATALAVSEGGTWLGAGDGMGTIHAWNTTTSRSLYRLSAHVGEVTALVVDPLGKWFASAGADGAVKMWRLDTGALIATLMAWPNGWAVLSPDGRYKISGEVGDFWWASGLCRFGVSDLDDLAPYLHSLRRIPEDEPLDLGN
ncbi:hypothetical protein GCM10029964_013260 [Kibdelosporangium lantanae]